MDQQKKKEFENNLEKMKRICSYKEQCKSEILQKLKTSYLNDDEKSEIIKILEQEKFINENRYAFAFANDKFKFNKWGKIKIHNALKNKSIPENFIQSALNAIDNEEYKTMLFKEFKKKLNSLKEKDVYKKKAKLMMFAKSRGYDFEEVNAFCENFLSSG